MYGGKPATCSQLVCPEKYQEFIGTWTGTFWAYVEAKSSPQNPVYRPYRDTVSYTGVSCFENTVNHDRFIVGKQTDDYGTYGSLPAKTETALLITGDSADGSPFLRTVTSQGTYDYSLAFHDAGAKLAVWTLTIPASGSNPAMTFTTIDGKDLLATGSDTRDVTITLQVGPAASPYWQGVIAFGSHTRRK